MTNANPPPTEETPSRLAVITAGFLLDNPELSAAQQPAETAGELPPFIAQIIWAVLLLLVAILAAVVYLIKRRPSTKDSSSSPDARFSNQQITQTFISAIPTMTQELNLEVATSTQTEMLTRSHSRSLLWGLVRLGTNQAQIQLPVTYRFHLRLKDPWHLQVLGSSLIVVAPAIRASLPPAIHTEGMEWQAIRGWARLSPQELLKELQRDLTPELCGLAGDPRRIGLVRETCRQAVAEFVGRWLEGEARWRPGAFTTIQVRFCDEPKLPPIPTRKLLGY